MSSETRKYEMRRRAEAQDRTRLRITEATMELHGSVGPARTSVSAIAERAGVRRSTVYRHFPDEASLLAACSAHWVAANPPPDPGAGLGELYTYFRRNADMYDNLLRDEPVVDVLHAQLEGFRGYLAAVADALIAGRRLRGAAKRRARAAAGHAVAFTTWRSLALEQGLSDDEAARLMTGFVDAAG